MTSIELKFMFYFFQSVLINQIDKAAKNVDNEQFVTMSHANLPTGNILETVFILESFLTLTEMYEEALIAEILEANLAKKCVENSLREIKSIYKKIPSKKYAVTIDYNQSTFRCAYIYYFAYCHTAIVRSELLKFQLENSSKYHEMMRYENSSLAVCSLGGGPGCDLIGLLHGRLHNSVGATSVIKCVVIDQSRGWKISLRHVQQSFLNRIGSAYNDMNIFDFSFIEANLSDSLKPEVKNVIEEADIVSMVKFVSVIPFKNGTKYLQRIFNQMKKRAFVFFVDNINGSFYKVVAKEAEVCGLNLIWKSEIKKKSMNEITVFSYYRLKSNPLQGTSVEIAVWQKS